VVVIGDGAQRDRLERLAAEVGAIRTTGRLPDPEAFRLLASAAVVINPQLASELQRSSSPVKLYYYAALGKPMVATRGPSVLADLADNDAARAPTSRTDFVRAVDELLTDREPAREQGENAARLAAAFRWSDRVDAVADVYQRIER